MHTHRTDSGGSSRASPYLPDVCGVCRSLDGKAVRVRRNGTQSLRPHVIAGAPVPASRVPRQRRMDGRRRPEMNILRSRAA